MDRAGDRRIVAARRAQLQSPGRAVLEAGARRRLDLLELLLSARDPAQCTREQDDRLALCADLTLADCGEEARELFAEGPPEVCDPSELEKSSCQGDLLQGICPNGRRLELSCAEVECGAGAVAQGCRIGSDDLAFCECACEERYATCLDADTLDDLLIRAKEVRDALGN